MTGQLAAAQHPSVEGFWAFVRERHNIWLLRKAGKPAPWTDDPTLATYHFCNVQRWMDHGTEYYLARVINRRPQSMPFEDLLWRTALYRLVNNTEWFDRIGGVFDRNDWRIPSRRDRLIGRMLEAGKIHSNAYIVLQGSEPISRHRRLVNILDELLGAGVLRTTAKNLQHAATGAVAHGFLTNMPGVGGFVALQIYRDLLLARALRFDENDFTYLGPGARGCLVQLMGRKASYTEQMHYTQELCANQPLALTAKAPIRLSLGDVEHCLCEAWKYWKVRAWQEGRGPRPRLRKYKSHEL